MLGTGLSLRCQGRMCSDFMGCRQPESMLCDSKAKARSWDPPEGLRSAKSLTIPQLWAGFQNRTCPAANTVLAGDLGLSPDPRILTRLFASFGLWFSLAEETFLHLNYSAFHFPLCCLLSLWMLQFPCSWLKASLTEDSGYHLFYNSLGSFLMKSL